MSADSKRLDELSLTELADAAVENFVVHGSWLQAQTTGMQVLANDEIVRVDCGLACDTFNLVCRTRLKTSGALEHVQAVINYFAELKHPFSWWLSPGDQPHNLGVLLTKAGLQEAETEEAMAVDLEQLKMRDLSPHGLVVKRVQTVTELRDFAQVVAENWTPPDTDVFRFYDATASLILNDQSPLWMYVGYLDDEPVASAELSVGGGVVGLYSICTRKDYRRRGFGTALTIQPLADARSAGYQTAVLQASAEGAKVYVHLGFQTFGQITEYKPAGA